MLAVLGVSGRAASGDALPTLYYTPGVPELDALILAFERQGDTERRLDTLGGRRWYLWALASPLAGALRYPVLCYLEGGQAAWCPDWNACFTGDGGLSSQ